MAEEMKVPFLGKIPLEPGIGIASDDGTPFIGRYAESETAKSFELIIDAISSSFK